MLKTLKIILATVILLCSLGKASFARQSRTDSLELHQAIHLALTNQPSLEKVRAQINALNAKVGEAKSNLYPQINLRGDISYLSPVAKIPLNGSAFQIRPKKNYNIHVAANQMIYNFGKTRARIQLAKSRTLTAKQKMAVVKWTISYFTAQTFYSILFEERNLEVVNKQLAQLKNDLDIAQKRHKFGAATNYDVLSIKVQIAEAKNNKLDIKNQRQKLKITLRRLFGWAPGHPVHVAGSLQLKPVQQMPNMPAIFRKRPDYQVLQQKERALQQAYILSKQVDNPSLSAIGTAGFKNGYPPDLNEILGNYSIGLQLNVPIFSGHANAYRRQEAKAHIQTAKAKILKLQRHIQADISKAHADVLTGKKKLSTANLQIKQAENGLKLARIRYKNGAITSNDLLAAETALSEARFEKVTTIYNILLSQYDLRKAMGISIWANRR